MLELQCSAKLEAIEPALCVSNRTCLDWLLLDLVDIRGHQFFSRHQNGVFVCSLTQVGSIGSVLVLDPGDLAILVLVILFPVLVYVLLDVPPLPVFDPVVQLGVADQTVLIRVDALYDFPERGRKVTGTQQNRENVLE